MSDQWLTIGTFVFTQVITLAYTIATMKGDGRVMRSQMDTMQRELTGIQETIKALADVKAEMRLIQERGLLQGQRVDELQSRVNRWLDTSSGRGKTG